MSWSSIMVRSGGGVTDVVGDENIYTSDEWVGKTIKAAYGDAVDRIAAYAGSVERPSELIPETEPPEAETSPDETDPTT